MSIHHTDPFATPDSERTPVRRLRGRLPAAVTLWTAPGPTAAGPVSSRGRETAGSAALRPLAAAAGLTVSSTLIADGEPPRLFGLLDDESDLWRAISSGGAFAVVALTAADKQLADRFAGLMPAPGGPFAIGDWRETPFGPVPASPHTWAGCRLLDHRPAGWGLLVEAELVEIELMETEPLIHYRGRYRGLD